MIYFLNKHMKQIAYVDMTNPTTSEQLKSVATEVEYCQADGDELEHAIQVCPYPIKPTSKKRVVTFTGDYARAIALNW